MAESAALSLYVVSDELTQTLHKARLALEDAVEQRNTQDALNRCAAHLHEARGVLLMVEVYGAALLAEEMEAAASHLAGFRPGSPGHDDGLDALTRSMVQLPVYLERMLAGGRDIALVLLPLLNDLRAVRGKPLMSESTLLLLNTRSDSDDKAMPSRQPTGEDVIALAQKLRPAFQLALLGWIKGQNTKEHLAKLARVADSLERAATTDTVHQLWWVVGAVLEGLADGALNTSVSVKRLLGQADREIKRLLDLGVDGYEAKRPDQLLNNLLYYVARTGGSGEKAAAVRKAFNLSELIPGDRQVEDAREGLHAPGAELMQTVAAVIREDLGRVKDVLDIYVRTGGDNAGELAPQLELLKKISDTLGVLGLGDLRGDIQTEIARLREVVDTDGPVDDATLIQIAATLLKVEDSLERQLTNLVRPAEATPDGEDTLSVPALDSRDEVNYQQVTHAVVRECLINLARLKESVARVAANNDDRIGIDAAGSLMRGVTAGLMMLGKVRAMEVSERILAFVDQHLRVSRQPLKVEDMDRLADAVVSLEYYLETIQLGRRDPWYMLDNAESCLDFLEAIPTTETTAGETQEIPIDSIGAELLQSGSTEVLDTPQRPELGGLPVVADGHEHIDPELLELFIEESREEIESIMENLPAWAANPTDSDALITIRRSYHTLKGSGRMVGAERMGEYCWSIEDLLNRLINKTLQPTPPMIDFVDVASRVLPDLVEQIEVGTEPPDDLGFIMKKAHAFAEGNPNAAAMRAPTDTVDPEPPEMDPVLKDIFSKEAASHLAMVREFVDEAARTGATPTLTDAVHRACHTLHGSANMANAERVLALTGALNAFARKLYDRSMECSPEMLGLFDRAEKTVSAVVAEINATNGERTDIGPLVADIIAATEAIHTESLPAESPETAEVPIIDAAPPTEPPTPVETPAPSVEVPPSAATGDAELDLEIAEIFGEEATELLEASDEALQRLAAESPADAPLQELKRHLHTLKGGARMAGIGTVGDLAHELESLLIAAEDKRIEIDDSLLALLQRSLDQLHRMRDLVVEGHMPEPATELMVAVTAFTQPGPAATPTAPTDGDPIVVELPTSETKAETAPAPSDAQPPRSSETTDDTALVQALPPELFAGDGAAPEQAPSDDNPAGTEPFSDPNQTWSGPISFDKESQPASEPADKSDAPADTAVFEDSLFEPAFVDADGDGTPDAGAPIGAAENEPEVDLDIEIDPDDTVVSLTAAFDDPDTIAGLDALLEAGTEVLDASHAPGSDDGSSDELDEPMPSIELGNDAIDEPAVTTADSADGDVVLDALALSGAPEESVEAIDESPAPLFDESDDLVAFDLAGAPESAPPPQRDRPGAPTVAAERQDFTRVNAELLEELLNAAGEISIFHSRLSQQVNLINFNLSELEQTVSRLRAQLRKLEIETETQIINRHQNDESNPSFDPLELDRYSLIQQLSRALAESASDVGSIKDLLQSLTGDADTLLVQQARVTAELQDGLMRTRMVPFSRHAARLTRLVRQTAQDVGKHVELSIEGASGELDRQVLEKMLPPFEHMLRNSVVHGIEDEAGRLAAGKPNAGAITMRLHREGSEMVIDVADDGAGLNLERIRRKAREQGLLSETPLSDQATMELILTPGFSTADQLTQAAGRGVGMDVVASEIKKLGGSLKISSLEGQGTNFTIRLPFTLAITQALIVRTGDEVYALPLPAVEGVARVERSQIDQLLAGEEKLFEYGERAYRLVHLGHLVGGRATEFGEDDAQVPIVLVRKGDQAIALLMDEMLTSREIVVKSVGPQIAAVRGVAGATILGDGRVVLILDPGAFISDGDGGLLQRVPEPVEEPPAPDRAPLILVVDDSITVRRVTERFLLRQGLRAVTAKDGIDAIARLEDEKPAVILLDIEMPRMDGYEFATHVRSDERFAATPIIMITSRVSEKHRAKAIEIGVNDYLGKPYQDHQLLETIRRYLPSEEASG